MINACPPTANTYVFLYKYLIIIHSLACFLIVKQFFVIGFREKPGKTPFPVCLALFAALLVPLSQIPASSFRYMTAASNKSIIEDPTQTYLDFFWSPMLTVFIVWLFQVFIAKFCFQVGRVVKQENIVAFLSPLKLSLAISAGFVTAALSLQVSDCLDIIMQTFAYVALGFTTIESVASSYILRGKTNLVSYTLFWLIGTWTFFVWWLN